MHSSSADCVFGEARLISSTRSTFAKIGPGLNSNSFVRWSNTFTPVTSDGSRSGVNWRRPKLSPTERASAFASVVFPTPGRSSMIRCPSLTRQSAQRRSVSRGAWTTLAMLSVIRSTARPASEATSGRADVALSMFLLEQADDLVEDRRGDELLRRLRDAPLAVGADERHLVLGRVEADVRA